jgi:hypothetical protein
VIRTLRDDGHAVFHAHDGRSAVELVYALRKCDLVISNTKVDGMPAYLSNLGRSSPEIEAQLPPGVPIIREPFTADELRMAIAPLLDGGGR